MSKFLNKLATKFPYALKILVERLKKEEAELAYWHRILNTSDDPKKLEQANGNIPNNKHRIEELYKVILLIDPFLFCELTLESIKQKNEEFNIAANELMKRIEDFIKKYEENENTK